jgi:predicted metallopeptidase
MKIISGIVFLACVFGIAFPLFAQKEIAFISDMQQPLWVEKLFVKKEQNERAADSLRAFILRRHPDALFLLGDMVGKGSSLKNWKIPDAFFSLLKQENIPYHAIQGNHEYFFNAKKGNDNFARRFGIAKDNVNIQNIDSVAVIMLNSNFNRLTNEETNRMLQRYTSVMDSLQHNESVRCIIVAVHHSPFTNSAMVAPSKNVQDKIVPKYLETPKAVLFLSGHAHLLEMFYFNKKYFCVIGGGGGRKQKTHTDSPYHNLVSNADRSRFFYCTVSRYADTLYLNVHSIRTNNWTEKIENLLKIMVNDKRLTVNQNHKS